MEATENRIKRALYRAHHRGTKEMDLILGRFADAEAKALADTDFDAFEALLALPDTQIDWLIKGDGPPPADLTGIVSRIRRYHCLEN